MATSYAIKWLKDKLGVKFFPVTHLKAVRDDNNIDLDVLLGRKQNTLVSGTNIKTINDLSILGSGNIIISGDSSGEENIIEVIKVNGSALTPDTNKAVNITVPTNMSDLNNDAGFITTSDIPEGAAASTTSPKMDGTASVGTEMAFARGDHRHPSDTSKLDVINDLAVIRSGAEAGATAYLKPSGGIPKTDLASAVLTSLGKADTALQSELDPVFSASAASGITSSDISNWNSKTSNVGTITGITMNGTSKGTSGVVDLGTVITSHLDISEKADKSSTVSTVTYNTINKKITKTINGTTSDVVTAAKIVTDGGGITSHQDISGKADKATTLDGYGITDAKISNGTITLGSNTITPLTSFTETDPVFSASVAAGIKASDITNWNGKTSNTGTITGVSVNGTSVATSGVANITSVPASILSGAIKNGVTATTLSSGDNSTKVATTAYVDTAINNLPEPMIFKGSLGTGGTITSLPTAATSNTGYTYKVITAGTYASQSAKVGDTFISDGTAWILIPSGDEPSGTVTSITIKANSPISIDSTSAITTSGTRTISHANSGVTAGTYRSVTVNATGHVTAGTNPTTLGGYGITDAKIANGVITLGSNTITPLTSHQSLANYVTLNTEQTISATKYFKGFGNLQVWEDTASNNIPIIGFNIGVSASALTSVGGIGHSRDANGSLYRMSSDYGSKYKIWDEGTDGSGSGLDADLLDGKHASAFALASDLSNYLPLSGGTMTGGIAFINNKGIAGTLSNGDTASIMHVNASNHLLIGGGFSSNSTFGSVYVYGYSGVHSVIDGTVKFSVESTGATVNGNFAANNILLPRSGAGIRFKIGSDSDADPYVTAIRTFVNSDVLSIGYETTRDKSFATNIYGNGVQFLYLTSSGTLNTGLYLNTAGNVSVQNDLTAGRIIKVGGTSSQFLKADGSVDSSTYLTSSGTIDYAKRLYAALVLTANTTGNADTMQLDATGDEYTVITNYNSNPKWVHVPLSDSYDYGGVVNIRGNDASLMMQLAWSAIHDEETSPTGSLWFRSRANKGYKDDWKQVAFTDSNVASATKLATTRTLWGQSFDGSANIKGNLTSDYFVLNDTSTNPYLKFAHIYNNTNYNYYIQVYQGLLQLGAGSTNSMKIDSSGNIYMPNNKTIYWKDNPSSGTANDVDILEFSSSNNLHLGLGSSALGYPTYINGNTIVFRYGTSRTNGMYLSSTGNLGIGTTSPAYKLDVNGVTFSNQIFAKTLLDVNRNGNTGVLFNTTRMGFEVECNTNDVRIKGYTLSGTTSALQTSINLASNGCVGIGTVTPAYNLDVNGSLRATSIIKSGGTASQILMADGTTTDKGWYMKRGSTYNSGSTGTHYLKVGTITATSTGTTDIYAVFLVSSYYGRGNGILTVSFRRDSASSTTAQTTNTFAKWILRDDNIVLSNYILTYKINGNTSIINLYSKHTAAYQGHAFILLHEGGWSAKRDDWTLYDAGVTSGDTSIPSDETLVVSTDGNIVSGNISASGEITSYKN